MHTIATIFTILLTIVYIYLYISLGCRAGRIIKSYHKDYHHILACYIFIGVISAIVWIWSYYCINIHEGMYVIVEVLRLSIMALLYGVGL